MRTNLGKETDYRRREEEKREKKGQFDFLGDWSSKP